MKVSVTQSHLNLATSRTIAHQAPLSMGFSRQKTGWVTISFSRAPCRPRDGTQVSCTDYFLWWNKQILPSFLCIQAVVFISSWGMGKGIIQDLNLLHSPKFKGLHLLQLPLKFSLINLLWSDQRSLFLTAR